MWQRLDELSLLFLYVVYFREEVEDYLIAAAQRHPVAKTVKLLNPYLHFLASRWCHYFVLS